MNSEQCPLLVGIDAGTSHIRALVFTPQGKLLATGSVPTPTVYPQPNWAQHDPEQLWQATVAALQQAILPLNEKAKHIVGIAVASFGEAGVLLDAQGHATVPVIAWFDKRNRVEAEQLQQQLGLDYLFATTGLQPNAMFSLSKLLWLKTHQTEAFNRSTHWLNMADYLAWKLCGVMATDYSLASRTLALDLKALKWSEDLLTAVDISPHLFAPLLASGEPLATVTPEVAKMTGLPSHCIVGVGGHDHIIGALAVNVWQEGTLLDSLGTAEALLIAQRHAVFDPRLRECGYNQGALVVDTPYYYLLGGMTTSGACVEWFRETIAHDAPHATLIAEAQSVPAGSHEVYFLPQMRSQALPYLNNRARGSFLGLTPETQRNALYRAVLEGLAYEAKAVVKELEKLPEMTPIKRILAIGGNTRNHLLMAIKATVFNQPIQVIETAEATGLGAALLGGLASRVYSQLNEAFDCLEIAHHTVEPESSTVAAYNHHFEVYVTMNHLLNLT